MTLRAARQAAGVLFLFCPAFAAAASQPRPSVIDRGADSYAELTRLRVMCQGLPESLAKTKVCPVVERIHDGAAPLPQDQREAFVIRNLPELAALACGLSTDAAAPEVLKRIKDGAAYMDNRAGRWDEAARLSAQVLSLDPHDRDALLNRAGQAVKLEADDPDGYAARALAAYGRGFGSRTDIGAQRERQERDLQLSQVEARGRQPPGVPVSEPAARLLREAASRLALKDYYGAAAVAGRVLAEDPNNTAAYCYRAAADNLIGEYAGAVSDASQALTIDPTETAALDARAFAYNRMGRFNDALADAGRSLDLNPKNPYAFVNRGFAHEKTGDLETMAADLRKAAELDARFGPLYHDVIAAYGLDAAPAAAGAVQRGQFLAVLLSSVAGGLLIALGLLHVFGARPGPSREPAPASKAARAQPSIHDSYVIGKALGQGGMGVVYEALDKTLGRKVAIKMLLDEFQMDGQAKQQLVDEARTVAVLHHPNIVSLHAIVCDDKGLYLVFEFLRGRTVGDLIARQGRLALDEARSILKPVCAALEFAHRRGVVHRDLKPANIMVTDQDVVKVMDFGVSRRIQDKLQTLTGRRRSFDVTNTVAGTPYYMAPEQEYGIVRPESDIYSLGTCLYEMATGRRPYLPPASHAQKMEADYPRPSALEPSLPRSFDMLIAGALHPDPDKRIRTAADFWSLLDAEILPS
jgi:tetratricopeptide (TPR) repeat protein